MIRRALILGLVALAGCSGSAPNAQPTVPSTLLLPSEPFVAPSVMFIGELEESTTNQGPNWTATLTVTILDVQGEPVAGAVVVGGWSEGEAENVDCITDEEGTCEVESDSIRKRVSQVVFEIDSIEHESLTYFSERDEVDSPEDQPRAITIRKP